jgi:NAD(P)-dependent dehydrogenase (short-subunit alcohol dehydrogenase family)
MTHTVLITGTSSGIGQLTAIYFAQQGWNVAATMRNPNQAKGFDGLASIRVYALDVTDNNSIRSAIDSAIQDFGRIDVLVNNAGFGTDGVFEAMSDEVIQLKQQEPHTYPLREVLRGMRAS